MILYHKTIDCGSYLIYDVLERKFSYIVATHTDRLHPHNHILFCASSNTEPKKYHDNKKTYHRIRTLSDELCREHGLSVIEPEGRKGKSYNEWKAAKEGNSWREQIRNDIDMTIASSSSYVAFIRSMMDKGYLIKGEAAGENAPKYISFRAPGQERFVRGSVRSLGRAYTREALMKRVQEKEKPAIPVKPPSQGVKGHQQDILIRTSARKAIIDTRGEKFRKSPGLAHWADVQNLKSAAAAYASVGSLSGLREQIAQKRSETNDTKKEMANIGRRLKELKELHYYVLRYAETLPFQKKYELSGDPENYMRAYEAKLILHDGAKRKLRKMGLDPSKADPHMIQKDIKKLEEAKKQLYSHQKASLREASALEKKLEELLKYIYPDSRNSGIKTSEAQRPYSNEPRA